MAFSEVARKAAWTDRIEAPKLMSKVAVVNADFRVQVVSSENGDCRTFNGYGNMHMWPVWSPNGQQVLFSGYSTIMNGHGRQRLLLHDLGNGDAQIIYDSEPGADAIAPRTPHYSAWSPDGRRVAMLARNMLRKGLSLYLLDPSRGDAPEKFIDGAPLFFSWSPNSRFLLVHSRFDHYIVDFRDDSYVTRLNYKSGLYSAPSWSPRGGKFALMHEVPGGRQTLQLVNPKGDCVQEIAEVDGAGAFSLWPKGDRIGLLRGQIGQSRYFKELWLAPLFGGDEQQLIGEPVFAFYWSPSGAHIAYVTPAPNMEGVMRLGIVNTENGYTRYMVDFKPTEEQLTQLMFFDQYSQTHNPWSPDGTKLVFTGTLTDEYQQDHKRTQGPSVFLVDVFGERPVRPLAAGVMGSWQRC
ncbi:MAG: hypothetical protein FJ319_03550 [SAR202 cluster bacterium]|nr:hypothetical protein [SAR202 cluster bacterium]